MIYIFFGFVLCIMLIFMVNSVTQKIIIKVRRKRNSSKIKEIRDAAYDEVLERCRAASQQGEVIYFSSEDIAGIIEDMKKN